MTTTDREFALLPRGYVRDKVVLANFREGLRLMTNPETGATFTEEEIQRATQPGSRWYNEAQSIDDYGQSEQKKGLYLADQIRPSRASGKWLEKFHAPLWEVDRLQPAGGSGLVSVTATGGTVIVGSTTPNDPAAYKTRDQAGNLYQVQTSVTVPVESTTAQVTLFALGTGAATNLTVGTKLTWTYKAPAMASECQVAAAFVGGRDLETEAAWAERIERTMREESGAGNDPELRAWTVAASTAIEDAFVYPCAFYAGSVLIAIQQKRGATVGPLACIPSADTLAAAIARMTPPGSPVVPGNPHVLVTGVTSDPVDMHVAVTMPPGSASGWLDARPFPTRNATTPSVTTVTSQTDIRITCTGDATLPGQAALSTLTGANAPRLMLWNATTSRFVPLEVSSIQDLGSNVYRVLLTTAPPMTIATGQWVSPRTDRHDAIALATEEYFDGLGPGQIVDPATDPRAARCVRYPDAVDEWPTDVSSEAGTRILEALGGAGAAVSIPYQSRTTPRYVGTEASGDVTAGPYRLTLSKLGVYAS